LLPKGQHQGSRRRIGGRSEVEGANAKDFNRTPFSAPRRIERKTTLRADWTTGSGITLRFFACVSKQTVGSVTASTAKKQAEALAGITQKESR
jgi:hypothetical protein